MSTLLPPSALDLLQTAIEKAGFTDKVVVGMDVAASEFYRDGKYDLDFKSPPDPSRHISGEELADIYQGFVNNYPGISQITDAPMSHTKNYSTNSAFFTVPPLVNVVTIIE